MDKRPNLSLKLATELVWWGEPPAECKRKIIVVFEIVHHVHCYAHQLTLIMQQATSHIPRISTFFPTLQDLLPSSPGHPSESPWLTKWLHIDFSEPLQHGGTSSVTLLTLCTRMTSQSLSGPSETLGTLIHQLFCFFLALVHRRHANDP